MAETNTDLAKLAENVAIDRSGLEVKRPTAVQSTSSLNTSLQGQSSQNSSAQGPSEDAFGALKALAEIGGMLLALAFVAGWSYMASYYMAFGLNPLELDFSVPSTSAFAIHVMEAAGWPLAVVVVVFVVLFALSSKVGDWRRILAALCIFVLLFVVAFAGSSRGSGQANADMLDTSPRLPNVGFSKKTASKDGAPSCLSDGTMDCKLLLHSRGMYYFFEPVTCMADTKFVGNLSLYTVAEGDVDKVHILRGVGPGSIGGSDTGGCK